MIVTVSVGFGAIIVVLGGAFKLQLVQFLDLIGIHQLVQLILIVLLPIQLLRRVIKLHGLRVQVHQVLYVIGGCVVIALLDLHLQL